MSHYHHARALSLRPICFYCAKGQSNRTEQVSSREWWAAALNHHTQALLPASSNEKRANHQVTIHSINLRWLKTLHNVPQLVCIGM